MPNTKRTAAEAARIYVERGWQPVPIPAKCKFPSTQKWQKRDPYSLDSPSDFDAEFPPRSNIGLIVGPKSGGLVDIDLDVVEAISLAKTFLPKTDMLHGRASKPLSHYWYRVPIEECYARKAYVIGESTIAEIRCSDGVKGFQTVVPPSVHPDGEDVVWYSEGEPATTSMPYLETRVRIVAAGALLAKSFPKKKGTRHFFALALSGLLLRGGLTEDEACDFVYEVCRVGGSTEPEKKVQAVRSTANALKEGAKTTGGPSLEELIGENGPLVIKKVREWLELTRDSDRFVELLEKSRTGTQVQLSQNVSSDVSDDSNSVDTTSTQTSESELDFDPNFGEKLKRSKDGSTTSCGFNAYLILKNSSATRNCFRFNEVSRTIVASGQFAKVNPEVLGVDVSNWLMKECNIDLSEKSVERQILLIALENSFDPIKDYLRSLEWDGKPRISDGGGWLAKYVRAEAPKEDGAEGYVDFVGKKWLLSMVARAMEPGCKADLVLVIEGLQGTRKSSFFEKLAGKQWFCDISREIGDKDSKMMTSGFWLAELPDLAALKSTRDQNMVKAFFSTAEDKFRPPYGHTVISAPRRIVFAGTTNDHAYLSDPTGNRRYCCVRTNGKVDLGAFIRDRDQLLAEAVHLYMRHVRDCEDKLECCCWWFTETETRVQEMENDKRVVESPEKEIIAAWWHGLDPKDRPEKLTTSQVAQEAFGSEKERVDTGRAMKYGTALRLLGFERKRERVDGNLTWCYVPTDELKLAPRVERRRGSVAKLFAVAAAGDLGK